MKREDIEKEDDENIQEGGCASATALFILAFLIFTSCYLLRYCR